MKSFSKLVRAPESIRRFTSPVVGRSLRHRAPLLWLLLPWMAGLQIGRLDCPWLPALALLAAALLALFSAWVSRDRPARWGVSLALAVTLAGIAACQHLRRSVPDYAGLPPREAHLAIEIDRLFPRQTGFRSQGGLGQIVGTEPHLRELTGQRVNFSITPPEGEPEWVRGQRLQVTGVLEPLPPAVGADSFEGFLADNGVEFSFTRGHVDRTLRPASRYRRWCAGMRTRFAAILGAGLGRHPELAGVLQAMLLGESDALDPEQHEVFLDSGTMHLFAISGLHIGVIALGLQMALGFLRIPRGASFLVGTALLWLYVDITGAAPSAVRAFVMVVTVQAAFSFRLAGNPMAAIAAAALLVLLVEPFQLFGASFQLSYGIVTLLLLFGLPLTERWQAKITWFDALPRAAWTWRHHFIRDSVRQLVGVLGVALAAVTYSTLGGVQFFQLFTPIGWLANLVLIPLATLIILGGFLSILCGLVGLGPLALLFNHAAALLLWGVGEGLRVLVHLPGTHVEAHFRASWFGGAAFVALIALSMYGYNRRWERWHAGFWLPPAFVALVLVFAVRFG